MWGVSNFVFGCSCYMKLNNTKRLASCHWLLLEGCSSVELVCVNYESVRHDSTPGFPGLCPSLIATAVSKALQTSLVATDLFAPKMTQEPIWRDSFWP